MQPMIHHIFGGESLMPHGYCFLWNPFLVWMHVASDILIGLSYYSIPIAGFYYVLKKRDIPLWLSSLYAIIFLSCGTTHFMSAYTIWVPAYWQAGAIKVFTAITSVAAATVLIPLMPRALALPSLQKTLQALTESEERLRLLMAQVTDYEIYMVDPAGYVVVWTLAAETTKGYAPEEIIGRHHSIFYTPAAILKGTPEKELKEAVERGSFRAEGWRVRKDGSLFWADIVTTPLHDKEGNLRGYSKVLRDITGQRMAAEKLRESEQRHSIIAEAAADAIITIDDESRIEFVNPAVEKIFGYTKEELRGEKVTILMPERLRSAHTMGLKRYLETGEQGVRWERVEFPGRHKSGVEVPLELSYGEFKREDRHFFIGIVRDITERKQAEQEKEYNVILERFSLELETLVAERAMSLMALTLADRVRNPASIIKWTTNKMLTYDGETGKLKDSVDVISKEADKLETVVRDFYNLLKSRERVFSFQDINEIVSGVLSIVGKEAADKGIDLVVNLAEGPLRMNAQKDLLRITTVYLLRNAIKATPEAGKITVATSSDGDKVILSITDTGPGIPKGVIDALSDPFVSPEQFGLGLPMIKQIVTEHMGKIEVDSEVGKGTTFKVLFPVRWISST